MAGPNETRPLARRLVTNTLHAASGRLVALVLWLALTPAILHAIGTDGYAVWSFVFALTGYLNAFDLGLAAGTLRNVAAARAREDHVDAGRYATLGVLGYVALGALWLALTPFVQAPVLAFLRVPDRVLSDASFAFVLGAGIFMLMGLTNVTLSVAQGYGRFDLANGVAMTSSVGQVAGILFALGRHLGLPGILVATAVAWGIAWLTGLVLLRLFVPAFRWADPVRAWARVRETFAFGGPMQVSKVLAVTHQQLDKILLSRWGQFSLVTPYDLALRAVTAASTLPQLLLLAVMPEAAAMHADGQPGRLESLFHRGTRWVLFASALVVAALLGAADRIFVAWIGHADPAAALALRGLALTAAAAHATGMGIAIARGIGRTDLEAETAFVELVAHLGLGVWLVPRMGLAGALVAVLAGNVVGSVWFMWRLSGLLRWRLVPTVFAPLAVPALAVALGALAGAALARALPDAAGAGAWFAAIATAGAAGIAVVAVTFGSRYITIPEVRELLGNRRAG
jgi:O-antigen/teichoic acid export membrane protein